MDKCTICIMFIIGLIIWYCCSVIVRETYTCDTVVYPVYTRSTTAAREYMLWCDRMLVRNYDALTRQNIIRSSRELLLHDLQVFEDSLPSDVEYPEIEHDTEFALSSYSDNPEDLDQTTYDFYSSILDTTSGDVEVDLSTPTNSSGVRSTSTLSVCVLL